MSIDRSEGLNAPVRAARGLAPLVCMLLFSQASAAANDPGSEQDEERQAIDFGETTIFARKREESILDVPGSVTVLGGKAIESSDWQTLRDASFAVPNLNIAEFSSRRLSFPYIRGVGSGLGDPAVLTYIDGVPQFGSGGLNLPLLDVERVEFLRGPQGTLYGRNSLGGVMHVFTREPSSTARAEAKLTLGEYDWFNVSATASGPLVGGGPPVGVALLKSERDGFTKNDFTGNDVDDRDAFYGRGQVLFTPGDESLVRFTLFGERSRDGGFVLSDLDGLRDRPHRINQDFEGVAERDVIAPTLIWERLGDRADFTSITAFQYWEVLETSDFDFSALDGVRRRTEEEQRYYYQELRFASPEARPIELSEDKSLSWQVGLVGFLSDAERSAANDFRPGLFPPPMVGEARDAGDFEDYAIGLYGQATLTVDDLELTGGLRLDHEHKEVDLRSTFTSGGFVVVDNRSDFDEDYDELLPRFEALYHLDEDASVYALAARGFKAGGFNLAAPAGQIEFDPETSWTYEVGSKVSLGEGRYDLGLALFYIDWEDMQLSQFDANFGGYVENAGESTSQGVELELDAELAEGLHLRSAFGLVDTEFDEFVDSFGNDTAGNDLPFAPENTWSVGALWTGDLGQDTSYYVGADWSLVGDFFYDAGNIEGDDYQLANFQAGVQWGRWGLDLSLRNAFDEEYVPIAFQPNPADPTAFVGESGAPRVFLASLRFGI